MITIRSENLISLLKAEVVTASPSPISSIISIIMITGIVILIVALVKNSNKKNGKLKTNNISSSCYSCIYSDQTIAGHSENSDITYCKRFDEKVYCKYDCPYYIKDKDQSAFQNNI